MPNNTRKNIKTRRQELIKLLGAGYPIDEIAIKLKCTIQTIYDDKKFISISGFNALREIGPEQLLFYYQTIESSIREKKKIISSILFKTKDHSKTLNKIPIETLLKVIEQDSRLDTQLKELYKDTTNLINRDYRNKMNMICIGLGKVRDGIPFNDIIEFKSIDIIDNESFNKEVNIKNPYMDLDLPKLNNKNDHNIEP